MTQLTFGIEYELKLRLTAAQVQHELDSSPDTRHLSVITNPGPVRLLNVGPQYLHNPYQNFAFRDSSASPSATPYKSILINRGTGKPSEYQGYNQEHLRILQKRLACIPGYETTSIHTGTTKQTNFSGAKLHLTTDASLNGLSHEAKLYQGLSEEDACITDFAGAEIVTAPHTSARTAATEAATISNAIGEHITDAETALHIHVGRPDGSPFSLRALQNLAYLCIIYEDCISHLTIPTKRGQGFETLSNRLGFVAENPVSTTLPAFSCDENGNVTATTIRMESTYQPLEEIKTQIFEDVEKNPQPYQALKTLMGNKGAVVNFSYCDRVAAAATVEFRQHFGTLEATDVLHWSRHCTALVALAHRYAESGESCKVQSWREDLCIEDLWRDMRLEEDTRVFYRERLKTHMELYGDEGVTPVWEVFCEDDFFGEDGEEGPDMWDAVDEEC